MISHDAEGCDRAHGKEAEESDVKAAKGPRGVDRCQGDWWHDVGVTDGMGGRGCGKSSPGRSTEWQ